MSGAADALELLAGVAPELTLPLSEPAPLVVAGRRWSRFGGVRYSVRRLLLTVTAFTLGHSLTLSAGAVGCLRLPSQPVEILIAVSIFVSALHALRRLFPGQEPLIAAGFGLVHGLAFATVIGDLGLEPAVCALAALAATLVERARQRPPIAPRASRGYDDRA